MSRFYEPTKAQERGWRKWVAGRPPSVRAVAERFDIWSLYRLKSSGEIVTIASFQEAVDGVITLTVNITGEYNVVLFDKSVFGIDPSDMEPCDAPAADAPVGTVLSADEVTENLDAIRCLVRPDLWAMGDDGKATRKN